MGLINPLITGGGLTLCLVGSGWACLDHMLAVAVLVSVAPEETSYISDHNPTMPRSSTKSAPQNTSPWLLAGHHQLQSNGNSMQFGNIPVVFQSLHI